MAESELRHRGHHDFPAKIKAKCGFVLAAFMSQAMEKGLKFRGQFHQAFPEVWMPLPELLIPHEIGQGDNSPHP